jgi:hypothetical protein
MTARWVEPEGTPEQIADACVAHLAAGGRVDVMRQTGRWEPTAVCEAGAFAYHLRNGTRFALVYSDPPQPEPAPAASRAWAGPFASPQPERPRGHTSICRCGGCLAAESARVDPPEGVTVIGWTEPTDDEPRSLPIVWGYDAQKGEWERRRLLAGARWLGARHVSCPQPDLPYVIRPIPPPPVPETERVRLDQIVGRRLPGRAWEVTEFGFDPMDGYVAQGHPSDDDLHPVAPFYVDADGYVSVLPLDGTDGD